MLMQNLKAYYEDLWEMNCNDIFLLLEKHFHETYKLPTPFVIEKGKTLKHRNRKQMYDAGIFNDYRIDTNVYRNLETGECFKTGKDIIDKYGYNFHVFKLDYYYSTDNIYLSKYMKEIDSIIQYQIEISRDNNGYKLSHIFLIPRDYFTDNNNGAAYELQSSKIVYDCDGAFKLRNNSTYSFDKSTPRYFENRISTESYAKAIKQMFGNFLCFTGTFEAEFLTTDNFHLRNETAAIKNSDSQQIIDNLVSESLPEINISHYKTKLKQLSECYYRVAVFQKVKENVSVLRFVYANSTLNIYDEYYRLYCVKNKYYGCKIDNQGRFIYSSVKKLGVQNFETHYMPVVKDEDVAGTSFSYYKDIINRLEPAARSISCLSMIKETRIEQLFKIGFGEDLCKTILAEKNGVIRQFNSGNFNHDQSNIFKFLGVNKKQVELLLNFPFRNRNQTIITGYLDILKWICMISDFSSMDINTFKGLVNYVNEGLFFINYPQTRKTSISYARSLTRKIKETNKSEFMNLYFKDILPKLSYHSILKDYFDYISMATSIDPELSTFKISVGNVENVERNVKNMHDNMVILYNLKKDKINYEKFMKNVVKVKDVVYESESSNFCVVAPRCPEDVANEGITLNHCVKSYIPRIADGQTNIVFIRKKDDIKTPFFTVEISNEDTIEQVHGMNNRNSNTEPGLDTFINEWVKKKHLYLNDINKVR